MNTRFAGSNLSWGVIVIALTALIGFATFADRTDPSPGERAESLNDQFACPTCNGQSVAESNAAVASTIRDFISDEIAAGATDTDIRNALVDSFGTDVLLNPPSDGIATLVWVLPVVALVGGAALIFNSVSRGGAGSVEPTADDEQIVAALLDDADQNPE